MIFTYRQQEGESNKAYFKRFNEIGCKMLTRDDPVIIAAFTYGILERDLFRKFVGREWVDEEEIIRKVNHFLRKEAEREENARY